MTRTLAAALALAAGLSVLSACSEGEAAPAPTIGDDTSATESPSPAPSESGSPAESAAPQGTFDGEGHVAMLGEVEVRDDDQQAVVDRWLAYWQVRMDAFAVPEADPSAIGAVAQGDAAGQIVSYVRYLEQKRLRTEGDLMFDISRVRVRGNEAILQTCVTNRSVDLRAATGKAAEPLTPFYEFEGRLARVSDTWTVTRVIDTGSGPC
jgi:hypothetical protein